MTTTCKLCGGRVSDIGDKGCPHPGNRMGEKHRKLMRPLTLLRNISWRSERIEEDDGNIRWEAHGPRNSFVTFEGPNAKYDCAIFMNAIGIKEPTK